MFPWIDIFASFVSKSALCEQSIFQLTFRWTWVEKGTLDVLVLNSVVKRMDHGTGFRKTGVLKKKKIVTPFFLLYLFK